MCPKLRHSFGLWKNLNDINNIKGHLCRFHLKSHFSYCYHSTIRIEIDFRLSVVILLREQQLTWLIKMSSGPDILIVLLF